MAALFTQSPEQPAAAHCLPASRKEGRNTIRVLQVEDSPGDVYLLSHMLRDASPEYAFDIADVPRLADALRMIGGVAFDIVLLDLNLPDIDGVAAVAALHAESPQTPIIVYSGMDCSRLREEVLLCGACHYLIKGRESPYSLRFMIDQAIRQRRSPDM